MRHTLAVLLASACLATTPASGQESFLHKKLADWRHDLDKGSKPAIRRSAAFALGRMGTMAAFALDDLERCLRNDRDDSVRDMAACAIGDIVAAIRDYRPRTEWNKVGKTLESALGKDASPRVRRSAAYALGTFGELALPAAGALKEALRDRSAGVRQNAAWALGRVGSEASIADLCERLTDDSPLVRRDAASALGQMGKRLGREKLRAAAIPLLSLVKHERDEVARKTALGAMATLADQTHQRYADDVAPLLDSKDVETARAAAYTMGNMGGEPARRALRILQAALADDDPGVQAVAAACLANAGADAAGAADDLARALTTATRFDVRRNCAIAISQISMGIHANPGDAKIADVARATIPALVKALEPITGTDAATRSSNEMLRGFVVEAISRIRYPHNEKAIPVIREILKKEPNQATRQRGVWTLFFCPKADLMRHDLIPVLSALLEETNPEALMVRYDAARLLAGNLGEKAPDRTCDVLLDMINNTSLAVFRGSGAAIDGLPDEGKGGSSRATASKGGDARYMAAQAMGWLGKKARDNKEIMAALRKAAEDADPMLKKEARESLKTLEKKD